MPVFANGVPDPALPAPHAGVALPPRVLGTVFMIALIVFLLGPRASPGILVLLALPAVMLALTNPPALIPERNALWLTIGGFLIYLCVNATWAVSPPTAYAKIGEVALLLALTQLAIAWTRQASEAALARIVEGMLIGIGIGTAYLMIELLSGQAIERFLFNLIPAIRPPDKNLTIENGVIVAMRLDGLNFNLAAQQLALWPAMLIIACRCDASRARMAMVTLFAAAAVCAYASVHETSKMAVVLSGLAFLIARSKPVLMRRLAAIGWIAAVLLVVPLALFAFKQELHLVQQLPTPVKQRIILWGVTAQKVSEAPIGGIGVRSTKIDFTAEGNTQIRPEGFAFPLTTSRHAHNVYLQTWYELGGIGAAFLLTFGLVLLNLIGRLSERAQPYALAGFVTAAVTAAFSWGMWQAWFMSAFMISVMLMASAIHIARSRE
ncbi:MAG: O-antigen ligase family protein [Hyphomicrobiaceae bacterium]